MCARGAFLVLEKTRIRLPGGVVFVRLKNENISLSRVVVVLLVLQLGDASALAVLFVPCFRRRNDNTRAGDSLLGVRI